MELSQEIQIILQKYRPQKLSRQTNDDYLIDVASMSFDDQTWLVTSKPVADLSLFFNCDTEMRTSSDSDTCNEISRQFDSRTFTRPKRNFNRPSIEKYNEELLPAHSKPHQTTLSEEIDNYMTISSSTIEDGMTEHPTPLHFDLTQPINTSIFENISSHSAELDSFQNMSPPSLVNSMCSSTFNNLMENSFIKNDPVLREICDADYSSVIYQEMEPPLYQSITESCSSINTEVAETFVRKTLNSLNCTFNKRLEDNDHHRFGGTQLHVENIDPNATYSALNNLNGTYRKNKSFVGGHEPASEIIVTEKESEHHWNTTFSVQQATEKVGNSLNNTYRRSKSPKVATLNTTFNKNLNDKPKIDNYMINEPTVDNHARRLSDEIDDYLNKTISLHSAKSTDSLDRLSSISNSSRDSKLMAEVDAIVEAQERSLQQVMSTPKPTKAVATPFDQVQLSPIPNLNLKEHLSDSEVSSGEYNTVRSRFSDQQAAKSWNNLKSVDAVHRKSVHPASGLRRPSTAGPAGGLRKESKITGSYGNLRKLSSNFGSSYTNLRPKSMVLPNIPARGAGAGTGTGAGAGDSLISREDFKVPHAPVRTGTNDTFVKPKGTGIPRPASKIPGPRASRLPMSKTKSASRTNLSDGNY